MRFIAIILLALLMVTEEASASDIPPTSRITLDSPARSELLGYTGETLTFSSATTSANCGTITERRWKLDSGSYVYTTDFSNTFTLPSGVYEQTFTLELRTKNSCNLYHTVTETITIRRDQRVYFIKDHLGSVRSTVNEAGDVIGYDDYYPFGLAMPGYSSNTANPNDNYKFTGHERDDEAGMTIDYMGARFYDPVTGRFTSIDPLADQFPGWTPYHYVHNNPLNLIDPTGMAAHCPRCDINGDRRARQLRNGTRTSEQVIAEEKAENKANAMGAAAAVTLMMPGPEDLALGAFLATKAGQAATRVGGRIMGAVGSLFKRGDDVADAASNAKKSFDLVAQDGNFNIYKTEVNGREVEFGGLFTKQDDVLTIDNFDIDGELVNEVGISGLRQLSKDFAEDQGVTKIIINGKRTTGANPGKTTKLEFDFNNEN